MLQIPRYLNKYELIVKMASTVEEFLGMVESRTPKAMVEELGGAVEGGYIPNDYRVELDGKGNFVIRISDFKTGYEYDYALMQGLGYMIFMEGLLIDPKELWKKLIVMDDVDTFGRIPEVDAFANEMLMPYRKFHEKMKLFELSEVSHEYLNEYFHATDEMLASRALELGYPKESLSFLNI